MGDKEFGIDPKRIAEYAEEIKAVARLGVQVGVVIGGGNIFRGISGASQGMDRVQADHMGNKIGTLVGLTAEAAEAGRDIAMQAAAMNPVALNRDAVPQEVIDRELEVGKDLARQEGKPEEMLEKIAAGRLNKFFKENTLVDQDFIKDSKLSVSKYLTSVQAGLAVVDFKRVSL